MQIQPLDPHPLNQTAKSVLHLFRTAYIKVRPTIVSKRIQARTYCLSEDILQIQNPKKGNNTRLLNELLIPIRECREMRGDSLLSKCGRNSKLIGGRNCHRKHVEDG
ncbi:hypothetical protein L6452_21974 [Arctium lappa]|uniref:Uncharacterized protein n=1 Tax=Arctium lappa TaxID=4217 RepID=A0ACB9AYJ3_ARCLA|nr:hypothetical protein L6452_21974 [Arctium lappa]